MNWSKAGKESILEQEAGKEVKTSGRETATESGASHPSTSPSAGKCLKYLCAPNR